MAASGASQEDDINMNENENNMNPRSEQPPTSSPAASLHGHGGISGIGDIGGRGAGSGAGGGVRRGNAAVRRLPISSEIAEMEGMVIDEEGISIRNKFTKFLNEFRDEHGGHYYIIALDALEENDSTCLAIDWFHLRPENSEQITNRTYQLLADSIQQEYYRFEPYLRQSIQNFVRQHKPNLAQSNDSNAGELKEFYISIRNFPYISQLRSLTTQSIGQLCSFSATVTRTTEVRPELIYGTFQCDNCGTTISNIKQQFKYSEPKRCTNNDCQQNRSFRLLVSRSKFVDWQKIRSQELSQDIPPGSMPRSIDVILRGEQVEQTKPGDNSTFTGTLIVVPDISSYYSKGTRVVNGRSSANGPNTSNAGGGVTGLRALGVRELNYKLVFLANHVTLTNIHERLMNEDRILQESSDFEFNNNETDLINEAMLLISDSDRNKAIQMKNESLNIYEQLTNSIAPNIYGHEEIKRGILLMLFGGVKKNTKDGVKLRGDINVCIIGDPSTAKSQFLKYVTRILPRTVYTSGKASSAAGLTAAVMRDSETGEFGIEAGALMLADNGVCCIDEFDKMDLLDQAAIHEAMEQQTITITKAGIQATLNARASILAAANPIYGRYDKSKPLKHNVQISAPIMSRFDLFFVILDECDESIDFHVASHIVNLHQNVNNDSNNNNNDINDESKRQTKISDKDHKYTFEEIQSYIRIARALRPRITPESHKLLVRFYRTLRQRDQTEQKAYRITVRQLESLIRLSESMARIHMSTTIEPRFVKEAARLLNTSIINVEEPDVELLQQFEQETIQVENESAAAAAAAEQGAQAGDEDTEMAEAGNEVSQEQEEEQQQYSISYSSYAQLTGLIVHHIRRKEISINDGIKQSDLENEIMKEKVEIISEDIDFENEMRQLRMVIQRLIDIDHIILIKKREKNVKDRILMVHPNYDPDSRNTQNLNESVAATGPTVPQSDADADAGAGISQSQSQSQQRRKKRRGGRSSGQEENEGNEDDDTAVTTQIVHE